MAQILLTADDLGLCEAVDRAIVLGAQSHALHSASFLATSPRRKEVSELIKLEAPELKIGLHFNLTSGTCCSDSSAIPMLAHSSGLFRNGFLSLMIKAAFAGEQFRKQIRKELLAQLDAIIDCGLQVNHIDGHRHVHLIPGIVQEVKRIAADRKIHEIRTINENLWRSLWLGRRLDFLYNGGLLKFILLRSFSALSGIVSERRFFSILYSCRVTDLMVDRIGLLPSKDVYEIMLHPACPLEPTDVKALAGFSPSDLHHMSSGWRAIEFAVMKVRR